VRVSPNFLLLTGSLLITAALYNHYIGHSVYLVEIVFVAAGGLLALYSLLLMTKSSPVAEEGMLSAFLGRYLGKEQVNILLPLTGFLIILSWSVWKIFVAMVTDLRIEDFIVTCFGLSLILYTSTPSRFAAQKDFIVLYLMFMTIVFAVLWNVYTLLTGDSSTEISAYTQYYFITLPVVAIAQLVGVHASAVLDTSSGGITNYINYDYGGHTITLGVGVTCSGLYSAGLFFSAFLAFVLVRYKKVDGYILLGLGVGLVVTWLSNILRMAVTVLVGSVWGHPALATFHSYFGIIAFVIFITVFWVLILRWLDKAEESPPSMENRPTSASAEQ